MSRLKVNTTVIRDYTWDDKPLEGLSREELIEAVKVLGLEAQNKQALSPFIGRAITGGIVQNNPLIVDAYAAQRQQAVNPCQGRP